jgi:hypothetical protein
MASLQCWVSGYTGYLCTVSTPLAQLLSLKQALGPRYCYCNTLCLLLVPHLITHSS